MTMHLCTLMNFCYIYLFSNTDSQRNKSKVISIKVLGHCEMSLYYQVVNKSIILTNIITMLRFLLNISFIINILGFQRKMQCPLHPHKQLFSFENI